MSRKIDLSKSPESHCPRFEFCEINRCPLSRNFDTLKNYQSDPSHIHKEKCTSKRIRVEIGTAFRLQLKGMTGREYSGTQRWNLLTEEERERRAKKLSDLSPINKLSSKGYAIVPKKSINRETQGVEREKGQKTLSEVKDGS